MAFTEGGSTKVLVGQTGGDFAVFDAIFTRTLVDTKVKRPLVCGEREAEALGIRPEEGVRRSVKSAKP